MKINRLPLALVVGFVGLGLLWYFWPQHSSQSHHPSTAISAPACEHCHPDTSAAVMNASDAAVVPADGSAEFPRPMERWAVTPAEPVFAAFKEWTERWLAATVSSPELLREGVALAVTRQRALADLMQGRSERALALSIPTVLANRLPNEVQAYLEEPINARGNLEVIAAIPLASHADSMAPMARRATIGDRQFHVFVSGAGEGFITKSNVALNGIALPATAGTNPPDHSILRAENLLALSSQAARRLDMEEVEAALAQGSSTPVCATSQQPVTVNHEADGLQIGGEIKLYCGPRHVMAAAASLTDTENLTIAGAPTSGGSSGGASSDPGGISPNFGTITNTYTQGYKRMLILRVDFPDATGEGQTITAAAATTLLADLRSYTHLMSFGTHELAPMGPNGSNFTPVLRMGSNASAYDNAGLDKLYPEARTKAAAAGYDLAKYDWFGVFTNSRPAAGYAGLAWVGGVGFHMANGYFSKHVTTHELGHNLGLGHAHRWDTTNGSIIGGGTQVEYGNPYDPIGATYDGIPGEKHFVASYKKYLGWIPDADTPQVTSGQYRVATSDDVHSLGIRGLRLPKDSRKYWIEYRAGLSDDLLRRAVFLQWGNSDGRESSILDARPGSNGTCIVIGKTFADPAANGGAGIHVTPMGLAGTSPESMDVYVQVGAAAGNLPPTAVIVASAIGVPAQPAAAPFPGPVNFTVQTTDPNNDKLAYSWDFGDGGISLDNQPTQSHTYAATGEYVAQVTVSDMKGGVARDSVIIRVENPTGFRIAGRVLDTANAPVGGIRLTATKGSESHRVRTDSDGTYIIPNLSAGAWTVTPFEEVGERYNFVAPFFTNPVTVGPNFTTADFIASVGPSETLTALVTTKSAWKYFSTGTEPASLWQLPAFDDSAWINGTGVLGYGNEAGQDTTIPYGGNATAKWTSYYFRKTFNVANKALFTSLRLHTLRDDGVVVYLNGVEIFRDNMPTGTPTYATFAPDSTEPGAYLDTNLPLDELLNGNNILAAEVHQSTAGSSDLAFDCALDGVAPLGGAGSVILALTSPQATQAITTATTTVPLMATAQVKDGTITKVAFHVDGASIGEDLTAPYAFDWTTVTTGTHTLKCIATLGDGSTETSANVIVKVTAPPQSLIAGTDTWRYLAAATAPATTWHTPAFVDASWPTASGQIGAGDTTITSTINIGPSTARYSAIYFRRNFNVVDPAAVSALFAQVLRDDGVVVYLNGVEVYRDNMPTGAITYGTLAAASGPDYTEGIPHLFSIDKSLLLPGNNVLAAEVHQSSVTSSDLRFQFWLDAGSTAAAARGITLAGPSSVSSPSAITLTTNVVAGGTLSVSKVEFYEGAVKLGTDTTYPFTFTWSNAPVGSHTLSAIATDSANATMTSNNFTVNMLPPLRSTALVSFGESWKYLDTGVAPSSTWTARTGFDESAWLGANSRLGYGGDGDTSIINYGNETGAKFITTWFRKTFNVTNAASFSQLLLRLVRDDGAVVYLNGQEIYRSNLPTGTISPTTLALASLSGADEITPIETLVPSTSLVSGSNVLAIEIHQAGAGSSDMGMNCELIGQSLGSTSFYITNPATSQLMSAAVDVPLTVSLPTALGTPTKVEYFAGAAKIGESTAAPFSLTWTTPLVGSYALTAKATFSNSTTSTTPAITITIDSARTSTTFLATGATWKYLDTGVAPAANWNATGFDDSLWKSGVSRLGFGADGELTAVESGSISYYFRTTFTVPPGASTASGRLRFQRDDGVIFYIDGVEVARSNMPAGPVTSTTLASVTATDETTWNIAQLNSTGIATLTVGTHVLSAEVHQSAATSSDLGFDAELVGYGTDASVIANIQPLLMPKFGIDQTGVPVGQYRLNMADSTDGRLYQIQCSTDMTTWVPYSYEFVRNGSVQVPVTPAGTPKRFYRAKWIPALP
jgi:hypothetical protein